MIASKLSISIILAMALLSTTLIGQKPNGGDLELARKIARFAPTTLTADTSKLSPKDRQALDKIIAAAMILSSACRSFGESFDVSAVSVVGANRAILRASSGSPPLGF